MRVVWLVVSGCTTSNLDCPPRLQPSIDAPVISADLRTPAEDIGATFRVTARGATGDTYDSELDGAQCGAGPLDVVVSGGAGATPLLEPG